MNFEHSDKAKNYINLLKNFMNQHVIPYESKLWKESGHDWKNWKVNERIDELKLEAKKLGLWNLFLPQVSGLTNVEYAPLAEIMGYSPLASEIFNCNAPDTGNMEVLEKYGSAQQKEKWLKPLLRGEIRSVFCMTEPDVASSDATNIAATIEEKEDHIILNGKKWWSTGIGHPNCKLAIFMGVSDKTAPKHQQHSMILVPMDTPGVTITRMLPVFNTYDAPYGHGEVVFENVKVPKENIILGLGKGFEIAQGRLGPGRIHHCMRLIGVAERALKMMIERSVARNAFGNPLAKLGGNPDIIANARISINMARLLVLQSAFLLDSQGIEKAYSEVSQIKIIVPNIACTIIDQAIQMHGGMGVSNDTVLANLYSYARTLRLADGPDEVHRRVVAKMEFKRFLSNN
jgi:acyl-CoA dehydrogenase